MAGTTSSTKSPVVFLQTHWDREWYQSFRSYQVRLAEVIDAIIDRLEADVFPCFMLDGQTVLLDDYLEFRPERKQRLEKLIKIEKLRIGPWYVMPDEFLVSGESLLRNLKLGIDSSTRYGQTDNFCGYLPDTFGHSADIPTIFSQCNIQNAIVWRGVNPTHAEFSWQSPSGKHVFAYYLADGYFQMMLHQSDNDPDLADIGKAGALKKLSDKLSLRSNLSEYLIPIGGDHLGPLDQDSIKQLKSILPNVIISTPDQFFKKITTPSNFTDIISGELTNNNEAFLLPGVYSGRVYLKQANRKLEHALTRQWEPLHTLLATLTNTCAYTHELQTAWKTLLLNHPHDSICGCSIDAVHRHNEVRFEEVNSLVNASIPRLQRDIVFNLQGISSQRYNASEEESWLVFNTSDQAYTGIVYVNEDHDASSLAQYKQSQTVLTDGYKTDFMSVPLAHKTTVRHSGWIWVENAPPIGYQTVAKKTAKKYPKAFYAKTVTKNSIENELYTLTVQPDGCLSIFEKKTNTYYHNLHSWRDVPQQGDSYNAAPTPGAAIQNAILKKIERWQKGPLVAGLILHYQIGKQAIQTRLWLEAGNPLLQFESAIQNKAPDHCLQIGFETDAPISTVSAESHFSIVNRKYDPTYKLEDHMPASPWKELKTNTGPIQRFIYTNNQAWFTDGISEYEILGNTLYLTYLRAFGMLSKADTGVRGAQAGPPLETPDGQCINRRLVLGYAWCPVGKKRPSELARLATQFMGQVQAINSHHQDNVSFSLLQWDNPHLLYTACYPTEHCDVILRLVNFSDTPQTLRFSSDISNTFSFYCESNALEHVMSENVTVSTPLVFSAFELKTLILYRKG